MIVYFVVLVNVAKGLRQVEPTHLELLRSYAASPVEVLRKARIPNAVPYLFTALKIAAPLAVITAFVAEYFGGPQNGLGYTHHRDRQRARVRRCGPTCSPRCCSACCSTLSPCILEIRRHTTLGRGPRGEHT